MYNNSVFNYLCLNIYKADFKKWDGNQKLMLL